MSLLDVSLDPVNIVKSKFSFKLEQIKDWVDYHLKHATKFLREAKAIKKHLNHKEAYGEEYKSGAWYKIIYRETNGILRIYLREEDHSYYKVSDESILFSDLDFMESYLASDINAWAKFQMHKHSEFEEKAVKILNKYWWSGKKMPSKSVYYFLDYGKDDKGIVGAFLVRDEDKSPRKVFEVK